MEVQPVITQEDIDWVYEGIQIHLEEMKRQMQFFVAGEHPEGQQVTPRNKIRYEAHAIGYLLNGVTRCVQYGKPIPKIRVLV